MSGLENTGITYMVGGVFWREELPEVEPSATESIAGYATQSS
jgi:hypothetical protein